MVRIEKFPFSIFLWSFSTMIKDKSIKRLIAFEHQNSFQKFLQHFINAYDEGTFNNTQKCIKDIF